MRLLVLGGTAFLGRAISQVAVARGHQVTCVARGVTGPAAAGVRLVRADRDHPAAGLGGVENEDWDCVVDLTRQPGHARRAAEALAARTAHAVFVSSGNVYADHRAPGADESAGLLRALDGDVMPDMSLYGEAKVACEQHMRRAFGEDRILVARAGLVAGPEDGSGRTGYWPWRMAHPSNPAGDVLVPDVPDAPCQVLDVRDLADWLVRCGEWRVAGTVNAGGDTVPFAAFLETSRRVAGHTGRLVPAPSAWLVEHGVQEWMGPRSLPLWLFHPGYAGFAARNNAASRSLGLTPRPLEDTLRDTAAWEEHRPAAQPRQAGLTDAEERELLGALTGSVSGTQGAEGTAG